MVREDGGTVELLRIEKQGQAEIPVDVTFSGGVNECVFHESVCVHVTLYVCVCVHTCACVNSCVCM